MGVAKSVGINASTAVRLEVDGSTVSLNIQQVPRSPSLSMSKRSRCHYTTEQKVAVLKRHMRIGKNKPAFPESARGLVAGCNTSCRRPKSRIDSYRY